MSANVVIKSGTNAAARLRVRLSLQRESEGEAVLPAGLRSRNRRRVRTSSAGRVGGPFDPEQAVLLRQLRRDATTGRRRSDSARCRRPPCATVIFPRRPIPIYDPLTGAANGSGRTAFAGNIIPREPARSDRSEADRDLAVADVRRSPERQLFHHRVLRVRPPQDGREGHLQPDEQVDALGPARMAEL